MNKAIYTAVGVLVLAVISFFIFKTDAPVKNYPSKGTDIIAFGDSLVFGVGATNPDKNFVSLLSAKIGQPIVNLGVSGDTTASGLARLSEIDKYNPKIVLLLLGGNDGLRQIPPDVTFGNLEKIIQTLQSRGAIVVLLGIKGSLLGDKYENRFEDLRDKYQTAYVSNVLSGLFGNAKFMADGIHPNDMGYEKIADRIFPVLSKLLE